MTPEITRRSALALIGASATIAAAPRIAAAATATRQPWLGTPAQAGAERAILEMLEDPAVKQLQASLTAELLAAPRTRALPAAAQTAASAVAQWTNSLAFAELQKDGPYPAVLWATEDTPRDWLGHHLGGAGTSGDNPDNIYRGASFEGGGRYEILGRYHPDSRPLQVLIQVSSVDSAKPTTAMTPTASGAAKAPTPNANTQINQDAFVVDSEGRFRITLGSETEGSWVSPNHLVIPPSGFTGIGVRDVLGSWKDRASLLDIRRIDQPPPQAFVYDVGKLRQRILEDLKPYVAFWSHFPEIWFGGIKPNMRSSLQRRPGGWGFVAGVNFHLAPDEAMVVTTAQGRAKYTGFQMNDPWMIQPDVRTHQVCLNNSQVTPNADGTVTYVLSARDPGSANWLDTLGYSDGIGILRWQAVPEDMTDEGLIRDVRVMKLSEAERLPGVPKVTAAQRRARVGARRLDYETRVR